MTEMERLIYKLDNAAVPYETRELFGTTQVIYPSEEVWKCDVICHQFSYGGDEGLLEIMGLLTDEEAEYDDVVGYLTADDVFSRIIRDYWAPETD